MSRDGRRRLRHCQMIDYINGTQTMTSPYKTKKTVLVTETRISITSSKLRFHKYDNKYTIYAQSMNSAMYSLHIQMPIIANVLLLAPLGGLKWN